MASSISQEDVRDAVRRHYAQTVVGHSGSACCGNDTACPEGTVDPTQFAAQLGYDEQDLAQLPAGANLGLSCGNPHAIAALKAGEVVVDLGAGAGFDCFLAARQVGPSGRVIGVDMTPEMVAAARRHAEADPDAFAHVEFRLGEIEALPIGDSTVDVILSNCVINLVPNKPRAVAEMMRILKGGGRIAFSDVVAVAPVPDDVRKDLSLISGCVGNAASVEEWQRMLGEAGFVDIRVTPKEESRELVSKFAGDPTAQLQIAELFLSAQIEAHKPIDA